MSLPAAPPALLRLGRELRDVCSQATQPEEIAAALEAHGLNDTAVREKYGLPDVFTCAAVLFAQSPYREPARETPPAVLLAWSLAPRGLIYALPGAALAVASPLLTASSSAQTALITSVIFAWGWGQGLALIGYRKTGPALHRFVQRATVLTFPVAAAAGAAAAWVGQQDVPVAALVGALAGTSFTAFACLLILGRPLLALLAYIPSLGLLILREFGMGMGADAAWTAVGCAVLLPLLAVADGTIPPAGLQIPTPHWRLIVAYASAGWACALFVTLTLGVALRDQLGAAALVMVIVSVGAIEMLSLAFYARIRELARECRHLGQLYHAALRTLARSMVTYLIVLSLLLAGYLIFTQPGREASWLNRLPSTLPLMVYGNALLLGAVVGNAGRPWITAGAWSLGTLVFLVMDLAGLPAAPLTGGVVALMVMTWGVTRVLRIAMTYR